MIKVMVTGSVRSGTTLMAAILNSQDNIFCLDVNPWKTFPNEFSAREDFLCFCGQVEAEFIKLGLPVPALREAESRDELIHIYVEHLRNYYGCENIGFKSTRMSAVEICDLVLDYGFHVIVMRRENEEILRSFVNRITPSLEVAANYLSDYLRSINDYDFNCCDGQIMVVDYSDLINKRDEVLVRISDFLAMDIVEVSEMFHSFNKGGSSFQTNTSHRLVNNSNSLALMLPKKYSNNDYVAMTEKVGVGAGVWRNIKGLFGKYKP